MSHEHASRVLESLVVQAESSLPSKKGTGTEGCFCLDGLSLQSGKACSGKLERILASIKFSSEFSRIHGKETQKSYDPTKAKCCKLAQQRGRLFKL